MKALTTEVFNKLRPKGARAAVLQVGGFTLLSVAAGMWLLPVGLAVAGASLLVLSGLLE